MSSRLYHKISKQLTQYHLQTITLDIFDTVLLHEYWPASLRQYDIAVKWLDIFQKTISPQITVFEIFSYREYAREQLEQQGQPLRMDLWLDALITLLSLKYDVVLDSDQHLELLVTLITIELDFEVNNSKPNRQLIDAISLLKQLNPELKVYFVADTHLTCEQIETLLDIFQIKIFDGGICSSDLGLAKQDGKIFEKLASELPGLDLMANLHIGDHRIPDYLMPVLHDSQAIHFRPFRMRGLRTLVGQAWMALLRFTAKHREHKRIQQICPLATSSVSESWYEYGVLISQAYTIWGWQLRLATELHDQENFLLAGKVADQILQRTPQLAKQENFHTCAALDSTMILRAFVWLLATYRTPRWDAARMLQILFHESGLESRLELYQLCFADDYAYSALAVESLSDEAFWSTFLDELADAGTQYTHVLQEAYETTLQCLPQDHKPLHFLSLSDDSTARLFHEFARLHSITNEIHVQVLDANLQLGQYNQALKPQLNQRRHQKIQRGSQAALALLRQTELAPHVYLEKVLRPELKKTFKTLQ